MLEFVARGYTNREIWERVSVNPETLHWHFKNSYRKLDVHTRTEAAMKLRPGTDPTGKAD